jgi:hypothetical protein
MPGRSAAEARTQATLLLITMPLLGAPPTGTRDLNPEYTVLSKKRIQRVEDRGIQLKIQLTGTAAGY